MARRRGSRRSTEPDWKRKWSAERFFGVDVTEVMLGLGDSSTA